MRSITCLAAFTVLAAVISLAAQEAPARGPISQEPLALTNANVIDVKTGTVTRGATLVLRGGKIESMSTAVAPSDIKTLDLMGKYLLPGLIDAHTPAMSYPRAHCAS